jgi:hypothetical protein
MCIGRPGAGPGTKWLLNQSRLHPFLEKINSRNFFEKFENIIILNFSRNFREGRSLNQRQPVQNLEKKRLEYWEQLLLKS